MSISCTIDLLEGRMQLRQTTRRNDDACSAPVHQASTKVHQAVRGRICAIVPRGSGVQCAYEIDSSLQVLVVLLDRPSAIDSETPDHRLTPAPGKQEGANVPGVLFTQCDEGLARVGGHKRFTPHDLFFLPHDVQSVAPSATPRVSVGWKSVSVPALHAFFSWAPYGQFASTSRDVVLLLPVERPGLDRPGQGSSRHRPWHRQDS